MNKAKLKPYTPEARKNFIAAVKALANLLSGNPVYGQGDTGATL